VSINYSQINGHNALDLMNAPIFETVLIPLPANVENMVSSE